MTGSERVNWGAIRGLNFIRHPGLGRGLGVGGAGGSRGMLTLLCVGGVAEWGHFDAGMGWATLLFCGPPTPWVAGLALDTD